MLLTAQYKVTLFNVDIKTAFADKEQEKFI